jgi:hypothetical protein
VAGSGYTIQALDESSWDAFARLVEANNGVFGGCWCMGFHLDDSREPALNRERKLARVQAGRAHAALVFEAKHLVPTPAVQAVRSASIVAVLTRPETARARSLSDVMKASACSCVSATNSASNVVSHPK